MRAILAVIGGLNDIDTVLRPAAAIATASGAKFYACYDAPRNLERSADTAVGDLAAGTSQRAFERRLREAIPTAFVPASIAALASASYEAILAVSREVRADLIVVSAPDSVADGLESRHVQVLRLCLRSEVAVLLARPARRWPPRRFLVPLSTNQLGGDALREAAFWTSILANGTEVPVRRSRPELRVLHTPSGPQEWNRVSLKFEREAQCVDAEIASRLGLRLTRQIRWGSAPEGITLACANRERSELIVLRRHQPGPEPPKTSEHAWIRVAATAACPVLLLPRIADASAAKRLADPSGPEVRCLSAASATAT